NIVSADRQYHVRLGAYTDQAFSASLGFQLQRHNVVAHFHYPAVELQMVTGGKIGGFSARAETVEFQAIQNRVVHLHQHGTTGSVGILQFHMEPVMTAGKAQVVGTVHHGSEAFVLQAYLSAFQRGCGVRVVPVGQVGRQVESVKVVRQDEISMVSRHRG